MKGKKGHKAKWLVLAAILLSGCSGDDSPNHANNNNGNKTEIKVNADVRRMMEGTRTTTFDNIAAIKEEGSFTCTAYDEGTTTVNTTSNVDGKVSWNGSNAWVFDDGEKHYWPESGNLDFFAYMPAAENLSIKAPYITRPTYTTARQPQFTCDMTKTVDKEFIYALTTGQNRDDNIAGVNMNFQHPFARIYFQLSSASGTAVTINSITISGNFYKTGTCTFDGADSEWSNFGGASALGTLTINTPYLVIPYNYGSEKTITVEAVWDEWSNFTTSVTSSPLTINWQAGYSYTYTLTLTKYALKVDTEKYTEQW